MGLNTLDRYRDAGLLVARLGFGFGFLYFHGWPKIAGGPRAWSRTGEAMANLGVPGGYEAFGLLAGLGEGLGGLLLALGLFFRPAALWLLAVWWWRLWSSTPVPCRHPSTRSRTRSCSLACS